MLRFFRASLFFGFCACFALVAVAAPWREVDSDLPSDPAVTWGELPNGLRYAILPNEQPANRVTLRLLVAVGSLHERDDERGLAHFLEHMIFRGTKSHPGDSLVNTLQRLGIGLGPDNTAFTHHDHTIYHLELPDAQEATLRQGLQVFREYAEEVIFDPESIGRERGVILSEKAMRDTAGQRLREAAFAFLWPNSRHARRSPIGTEETVNRFTREDFVAFYDAWYRPERLAVIIVGKVDPAAAPKMVEDVFGSLTGRGEPREEPTDIVPTKAAAPDIRTFSDPGLGGVSLTFEHPEPMPRERHTREQRVHELHRTLAFAMFRQRLDRISHAAGGLFVAPTAHTTYPIPEWQLATFDVSGNVDNWRELAANVEQEHRRAYFHGFTERELARAKASFVNYYADVVRTAPTRRSEALAAQLTATFLYGAVFAHAEIWQADLAGPLEKATLADCLAAFREAWSNRSLHVFVATHPDYRIGEIDVAQTLNASRQVSVAAPVEEATAPFAYTHFGRTGRLVRNEHLPDLDVRLAQFANGVRLNFKSMNTEADTVLGYLRVGTGKLARKGYKPGLDLLAEATFTAGGVKRHAAAELRELFAGRTLSFSFHVEPDALLFGARCAPRDLAFCLQAITAYITDPAFRPEVMKEARASFGSLYSGLGESATGLIRLNAERMLLNGDPRFGIPPPNEAYSRTLDELARWMKPQLKNGPIELSVVGDLAWEDAAVAVANTVGSLPRRKARPEPKKTDEVTFAAAPPQPIHIPTTPTFPQAALAWYWPVTDVADVHQERRCVMLAEVIGERLRARLRDEMGSSYAPGAAFGVNEGFPTFSYFIAHAQVEPSRVTQAAALLREEVEALRSTGIAEDEFLRVRQPFLSHRADDLRTPDYWAYTVLRDAQQRPQRIAAARNRASDNAAITREELEALARRYLDPARGFLFVAEPPSRHAALRN